MNPARLHAPYTQRLWRAVLVAFILFAASISLHAQNAAAEHGEPSLVGDPSVERGDPAQGGRIARGIAGRYRHRFQNGNVSGDTFYTTDTLTLEPVGAASVHFDADLNFTNGHICSLSGGALYRKDGTFVFDDAPENQHPDRPLCRLAIEPVSGGIKFHDLTGGCQLYCGTRGSWDGSGFTFAQRVPTRSVKQR